MFASTFWPTRVRLKPKRNVLSVEGGDSLAVFAGKKLVAREERAGELWKVCREQLVCIVKSVAREELIAVALVVIHAPLQKVLANLLAEAEAVSGESLSKVRAVG